MNNIGFKRKKEAKAIVVLQRPLNYQNMALYACRLMEAVVCGMLGWECDCVCVKVVTTYIKSRATPILSLHSEKLMKQLFCFQHSEKCEMLKHTLTSKQRG